MNRTRGWYLLASGVVAFFIQGAVSAAVKEIPAEMSDETRECVACHKKNNPSIVQQWGSSKHYGANVGCYECHQAEPGDKDAFIHDDKKVRKHISTIVSPTDCANCHNKVVEEFAASHHSKGGRILGSLDNLLAEVIEGNSAFVTPGFPEGNSAAAVNGCWQCHGSQVKVLEDGQLEQPATDLGAARNIGCQDGAARREHKLGNTPGQYEGCLCRMPCRGICG